MVTKYGMSDSLGPVVYDAGNGEVFLGKDYGHVNNYSDATSTRIDDEVERIMRAAYAKTEKILTEHFDKLELIANTLLEREKINGEEFESLMKTGKLPEAEETAETVETTETVEETTVSETEEPLFPDVPVIDDEIPEE